MKYVNKPNDIPEGEHFAILEFSSIHHEGDERSRTNPGHGYPAYDEPSVKYIAFDTKEEFLYEIRRRSMNTYSPSFVALSSKKLVPTYTVDVKV
jgi:hypothetical protein